MKRKVWLGFDCSLLVRCCCCSTLTAYGDVDHSYPQQRPDNNQQFPANLGENVTLTCNFNDKAMQTQWEREDGQPLPPNAYVDRDRLEIFIVQEQNLGKYRCNAIDSSGNRVAFVVRELVLLPLPQITFQPNIPLVVEPDRNVEIYCHVSGASPEHVIWASDNNRPLPR